MSAEANQAELRAAWTDLIDALNRARDGVDSADWHAPPVTAQGLADGYRYLLGFVFSGIERSFFEDPDYPYFRRAIQPQDKATIDNADALYLSAAIDGAHTYRVHGRLVGPKPPQYIIFEAHSVYAGDTGSLAELAPGGRVITGLLDTTDLAVDDDGRFEILLAPQRPADYDGNFIATATADGALTSKVARFLVARMLFHDWEHEASPDLHIARIGREGTRPAPIGPATAAERIRRVGTIAENQMRFWNEFYDVILEAHGDKNGDGVTFMPRNDLNQPALANLATGGGQSTNVFSGGVYDLPTLRGPARRGRRPGAARLHGLSPLQPVGRITGLRQPHLQPQRFSGRTGPRRDGSLCGRRDRPRRAELARHRRPPVRIPHAAVDLLHGAGRIAESHRDQAAGRAATRTPARRHPRRLRPGTSRADQNPPGARPAQVPPILTR